MKKRFVSAMLVICAFLFVATGCQATVSSDSTDSGTGNSSDGDDSSEIGTTTKTDTSASATNGKLDTVNGGDTIGFKKYCTTDFSVGVWYCYDLDWDDSTTPDIDEGLTAALSKGTDGGYHIIAQKRACGATYFGCNLAGGSNYGAAADINGAGFTKIKFKIRGTVPASSLYVAAILNLGSDKFVVGAPASSGGKLPADGKDNTMANRCSGYNSSTWTECTVPVSPNGAANFVYSSVFTIATIDGIPDKSWVEVKDVEWLDSAGENVAPYKI